MLPSEREILNHIYIEAKFVVEHTKAITYDEFIENEILIRAVERSLMIIGEAAKMISEETKHELPQIEWRGMAGLRDKLIHHYFGVDYEIVWSVVTSKIPDLYSSLIEIVNRSDS